MGEHWIYEAGITGLYFPAIRRAAPAPRLGAKYLLNEKWRIKTGFGRHYQVLTSLEDDDDPVILFDAWLPTPKDRPIARADHYGLGVEVTPSTAVEANAELYYHRYDHLTRYNQAQRPGEPFYLDGWGETHGLELRAHYSLKNYYGFANYALGRATSHFFLRHHPMRSANDFRWQTFPSNADIRHILNGVIGIRPRRKWDFSSTNAWISAPRGAWRGLEWTGHFLHKFTIFSFARMPPSIFRTCLFCMLITNIRKVYPFCQLLG